jgi:hypothetical protein
MICAAQQGSHRRSQEQVEEGRAAAFGQENDRLARRPGEEIGDGEQRQVPDRRAEPSID